MFADTDPALKLLVALSERIDALSSDECTRTIIDECDEKIAALVTNPNARDAAKDRPILIWAIHLTCVRTVRALFERPPSKMSYEPVFTQKSRRHAKDVEAKRHRGWPNGSLGISLAAIDDADTEMEWVARPSGNGMQTECQAGCSNCTAVSTRARVSITAIVNMKRLVFLRELSASLENELSTTTVPPDVYPLIVSYVTRSDSSAIRKPAHPSLPP